MLGQTKSIRTPDHALFQNEAAIDFSEFRQGWRVLLLSVVGIAISINASLLYGFGTLVVPLEQAFGWSKSEQQVAITFLFGGAVVSCNWSAGSTCVSA